jgi:magnesium transporter
MIRAVDLRLDKVQTIGINQLHGLDLHSFWLQLIDPDEEELRAVSQKTDIPSSFLDFSEAQRKINFRSEEGFVLLNFVVPRNVVKTKDVNPLVLAVTKTFLISVSKKDDQAILDIAKNRMSKNKLDQPALVAYFIISEVVSGHYAPLEQLESLTSNIEEEVVEKTRSQTLNKIFNFKSKLISFNKILWYERGLVFNLMNCGHSCMTAKARDSFSTVHEDLTRQIDIVETYREIMSDAINVHLSAVSNKINLSIKSLTVVIFYLTVVTTVTVFPNTVATFFGISRFGNTDVWIIAVVLIFSIILPYVWLWRKKWLKFNPKEDREVEDT